MTHVKVNFANQFRRFLLTQDKRTYEGLLSILKQLCEIEDSADVVVKYYDDEGDLVSLSTSYELETAIELMNGTTLKLILSPLDSVECEDTVSGAMDCRRRGKKEKWNGGKFGRGRRHGRHYTSEYPEITYPSNEGIEGFCVDHLEDEPLHDDKCDSNNVPVHCVSYETGRSNGRGRGRGRRGHGHGHGNRGRGCGRHGRGRKHWGRRNGRRDSSEEQSESSSSSFGEMSLEEIKTEIKSLREEKKLTLAKIRDLSGKIKELKTSLQESRKTGNPEDALEFRGEIGKLKAERKALQDQNKQVLKKVKQLQFRRREVVL